MISALGITWPLASIYGYGIYGLEIAQSFFRLSGQKLLLTKKPMALAIPPLLEARLSPALRLATEFDTALQQNPQTIEKFPFPVLHGAGNDFAGFPNSDQIHGQGNIGCVALENLYCSPHGLAVARNYDQLIAISEFNAAYLRSLKVAPVHLCHQGIDTDLFYPQPKRGLLGDRFVIFSGGKFEFRKGQDIVLAAFKQFAAKYPEALLLCAWQSQSVSDPTLFQAAGHITTTPIGDGRGALRSTAGSSNKALLPTNSSHSPSPTN